MHPQSSALLKQLPYSKLQRKASKRVLNMSRVGHPTTSEGSPFQCSHSHPHSEEAIPHVQMESFVKVMKPSCEDWALPRGCHRLLGPEEGACNSWGESTAGRCFGCSGALSTR